MRQCYGWILILTLMIILPATTYAAKEKPASLTPINPLLLKQGEYAFPYESGYSSSSGVSTEATSSLGELQSTTASPGVIIGDTWYDYQHNGRMPRMVDWGYTPEDGFIVHFTWMDLPGPVLEHRKSAYNAYLGATGTFIGECYVQPAGDYAGYVALDVTDANEAVIACHNDQGAGSRPMVYWDFAPAWCFFSTGSRVPDSLMRWDGGIHDPPLDLISTIWPDMIYQEVPGHVPVTHLFCQQSQPNAADPQAIYYFRKEGVKEVGDWDFPPYVVDTVFDIAQSVTASSTSGKMALAWIANRPADGDPDTASANAGQQFVQWDNDIYYQASLDYGVTFLPRVNLTSYQDGEAGHRPYTDMSLLLDSNDDLHIAWNGRVWPGDANQGGEAGLYACRMFHWGENLGTGGFDGSGDAIIRTAANLEWDQTTCTAGAWNIQGSKMTLSECNGKLYYLYVQYNDIPAGVEDDCAERGLSGDDITGAANGELYMTVSADGGLTWEQPRNLTNTRTPGCDSATGVGGPCDSENWPSMARFGTDHTGNMSQAYVLDPTGSYAGSHYLDIQFIHDNDPGGIVQDEGTWQLAEVQWFRMPCYEPVPCFCPTPIFEEIGWPTIAGHGEEISRPAAWENYGNNDVTMSVSVFETNGPTGWLTTSFPSSFTVLSGFDNRVDGEVIMNTGGIVNSPPGVIYLQGGLVFSGNYVTSPDTLHVECWVTGGFVPVVYDTAHAGCMALTYSNSGNAGNSGEGGVNLDFFNYGDCDYVEEGHVDTIPGDADVYLYDGSPIICWRDETDTVRCNYSMFQEYPWGGHGFVPKSGFDTADYGNYLTYSTEFMTQDSSIGLTRTLVAPQGDTCDFIAAITKVYSENGESHSNLIIGEGMDWDIPADSGSWNRAGFDSGLKLMYQVGSEFTDSLGDILECQDNNQRFGGTTFLKILENGQASDFFANMYTMDNSTQVYGVGHFVGDSLWKYMGENTGYTISDSTDADLHMVFTYRNNYTLGPEDTLAIYTVYVTGKDGLSDYTQRVEKARAWACANLDYADAPCCEIPGDINNSGEIDISDLVAIVSCMFQGGTCQFCIDCPELCDFNGDGAPMPDIADLVYLVAYMFSGGPPLPPCGGC